MKSTIKRLLPPSVVIALRDTGDRFLGLFSFMSDRRRYQRYAGNGESSSNRLSDDQLEAQLTKDYHRVEKGLALATPKRPFGADVATRLDALIPRAEQDFPGAGFTQAASAARDALQLWNQQGAIENDVAPVAADRLDRLSNAAEFFETRHSVRNFSSDVPDGRLIEDAVRLAAFSPSVCNRQPWQVRLYSGADVARLLAHQNGNRGFRENVPMVMLVTTNLGHFAGRGERNQAWVEGGIFASSLVWSLHALGLDSCMLNLSLPSSSMNKLRAEADLKPNEVAIMMVAIGYGAAGHRVAKSGRRQTMEILRGA